MMKILVTGAAGFLGRGICEKLINNNVEVIAACLDNEHLDIKGVRVIHRNIFSSEDPYSEFGKPDSLLHLAWRNGFDHSSPYHLEDLPRHFSFIESMIKSGVSSISVMGTMHEIGFWNGEIDENTPCNPLSLYGIAKNALRESIETLRKIYDFDFKWLRGFYIVSNATDGNSIFSKIARASIDGKKTFPFNSGNTLYDFLSYDMFCESTAAAVLQDSFSGIINICSGNPKFLKDVVEEYIADNHFDIELDYGAYPDRPYDSKGIWGDATVINEIMRFDRN